MLSPAFIGRSYRAAGAHDILSGPDGIRAARPCTVLDTGMALCSFTSRASRIHANAYGESMVILLVAAILFASASLNISAQVQARHVDIRTPDGTILKASYFSAGKPGPGVLLLHQCRLDRHAWDRLAADLASAGMHVLAFDYRGYGETTGTLPPPPPSLPQDANTKFSSTISGSWTGHKDVELAYGYL